MLLSMEGRDWGAGDDKEPFTKLVISTLLTTTKGVFTRESPHRLGCDNTKEVYNAYFF